MKLKKTELEITKNMIIIILISFFGIYLFIDYGFSIIFFSCMLFLGLYSIKLLILLKRIKTPTNKERVLKAMEFMIAYAKMTDVAKEMTDKKRNTKDVNKLKESMLAVSNFEMSVDNLPKDMKKFFEKDENKKLKILLKKARDEGIELIKTDKDFTEKLVGLFIKHGLKNEITDMFKVME